MLTDSATHLPLFTFKHERSAEDAMVLRSTEIRRWPDGMGKTGFRESSVFATPEAELLSLTLVSGDSYHDRQRCLDSRLIPVPGDR